MTGALDGGVVDRALGDTQVGPGPGRGGDAATPGRPGTGLAVAAMASLSAGTIHAGAVAAHSEHRQAVLVLVGLAVAQLVWGACTVARPGRRSATVGLALGLVAVAGWTLAKSTGLPLVDGLDRAEPVRLADGLATGLALVTIIGAAARPPRPVRRFGPATVAAGLALRAVTGPGLVAAIEHRHEGGAGGHADASTPAVVPPTPFDPARPIDLGGVEGVSPAQQARAENLLAVTVARLGQWADPAHAEANGFHSIGDGATGVEHLLSPANMADDVMLDPDAPESLVFDTSTGTRRLVAAMYMMPPGATLDDVPDIGGPLTQWHIHDDLCFDAGGRVAGLTASGADCAAPLVKGPQVPMIHVWIEPHPCGPFAALEGIAAGQVAEGEAVACDRAHGS